MNKIIKKFKYVIIIVSIILSFAIMCSIIYLINNTNSSKNLKIEQQCQQLRQELITEFNYEDIYVNFHSDYYGLYVTVYREKNDNIIKKLYEVKKYVEDYLKKHPDFYIYEKKSDIFVTSPKEINSKTPTPYIRYNYKYSDNNIEYFPILSEFEIECEDFNSGYFSGVNFDVTKLKLSWSVDVEMLKSFPNLKTLDISGKSITKKQFEEIKQTVPTDCEILYFKLTDE